MIFLYPHQTPPKGACPMKQIYLIGNAHIDPVWLWNRAEGMQEVKSSFASALDRMEEFADFRFSQTSISFLAWLKETLF